MEREIYTPKLEQVPAMPELRTLFTKLGEERIRSLVNYFYDLIPKSSIANMFPDDLTNAKQDQADFLIQVLGGPSYYSDRKGHPRMRMRHFPFIITEESRQAWYDCYVKAIHENDIPEPEKSILISYLETFSRWMVNSL
jgi:hemoglobin